MAYSNMTLEEMGPILTRAYPSDTNDGLIHRVQEIADLMCKMDESLCHVFHKSKNNKDTSSAD